MIFGRTAFPKWRRMAHVVGILGILGCLCISSARCDDQRPASIGPRGTVEGQVSHALHEISGAIGDPTDEPWTRQIGPLARNRHASENHAAAASEPPVGGGPSSLPRGDVSPLNPPRPLSSNLKLVLKSVAVGVLGTLFVGLVALVPFVLFKGGAATGPAARTPATQSGERWATERLPATPPMLADFPAEGPFLAYVPTIASFVRPMSATQDGLPAEVMAFQPYGVTNMTGLKPARDRNAAEHSVGGERCATKYREQPCQPPTSDAFMHHPPSSADEILGGDDLLREYWERDDITSAATAEASGAVATMEPPESPLFQEVAYQRELSVPDHSGEGGVFQQILEENIQLRGAGCGDDAA